MRTRLAKRHPAGRPATEGRLARSVALLAAGLIGLSPALPVTALAGSTAGGEGAALPVTALAGSTAGGEGAARSTPATSSTGKEAAPTPLVRQMRLVMGSRLEIMVEAASEAEGNRVLEAAFAEVARLDALLSNYKPDSPLSRLGRTAGQWQKIDPELFRFLERSRDISRRTDGAFDVTVAPLLALWRAGTPDPASLEATRRLVGWKQIGLKGPDQARLARAGMGLDPGGIGKGYAVDAVVALLKREGIRNAFIDFGGSSFYGLGDQPGQHGWAVAMPGTSSRPEAIILRDLGLSSSMTRPPLEDGTFGKPHIVDPRTGRMVEAVRTAVVASPSATEADVLSTTLIVRGPGDIGTITGRFPNAQVRVIEDGKITESPGLKGLLEAE